MTERQALMFSTDCVSTMIQCVCGDVFHASGKKIAVDAMQRTWEARHKDCVAPVREPRKVFWLSFCDGARPKGEQFLGACIVEVTAEEVEAAAFEVALRFPLAQPGAEWIAAASRKAWALGCNPGGEMASMEIPVDEPNLARYTFGVLMDRATVERLDLA